MMRTRMASTGGADRAGFTVIELLVTIAVIAVLAGLYVTVVRQSVRDARGASDTSRAVALSQGVELFRQELGFLPPVIVDGQPLDSGIDPFDPATGIISTRTPAYLRGRDTVNDPFDAATVSFGATMSDKRYSKLSLSYLLAGRGTTDDGLPLDGVSGEGMRPLRRIGVGAAVFEPTGRTLSPFFTPRSDRELASGYLDPLEYGEHGVAVPGAAPGSSISAVVDSNRRAYRYYRWESLEPTANDQRPGAFLGTPLMLRDPQTWGSLNTWPAAASEVDPNLMRSSGFAIVSPGPSGVFGSETRAVLERAIPGGESLTDAELRQRAWQDNIVISGGR